MAKPNEGTALVTTKTRRSVIEKYLDGLKPDLKRIVGDDKIERFIGIALLNIRQDSKLLECEPRTLMGSICRAANLRLELDRTLGFGWIVPFWSGARQQREAEFIVGYKGMVRLIENSPLVKSIVSRLVWQDEVDEGRFTLEESSAGTVFRHRVDAFKVRNLESLDGCVGGYSAAYAPDGSLISVHPMALSEILLRRDRGGYLKAKGKGPWTTDPHPMARKTTIRGHFPFLPVSTVAIAHANREESIEGPQDARESLAPLDPEEEVGSGYTLDVDAEYRMAEESSGEERTEDLARELESIEIPGEPKASAPDPLDEWASDLGIDFGKLSDAEWSKVRDIMRAELDAAPGKDVKDRGKAVAKLLAEAGERGEACGKAIAEAIG